MDSSRKEFLQVMGLHKTFSANGSGTPVLQAISLSATRGSITGVLGVSGCGKTTLLNVIAGFLEPDKGEVRLNGRRISGPGPDRGVVFQEDALFPWLSVRENIAMGLKRVVKDKTERNRRIDRILELVRLQGYSEYLPGELSGGMKQRVALARVLVLAPQVLLMDEPFASLDAQTREAMQKLLLEIQEQLDQTILFVTHDVEEALILSDQLLLLPFGDTNRTETFDVDLPRPRNVDSSSFLHLKRELRARLASASCLSDFQSPA